MLAAAILLPILPIDLDLNQREMKFREEQGKAGRPIPSRPRINGTARDCRPYRLGGGAEGCVKLAAFMGEAGPRSTG